MNTQSLLYIEAPQRHCRFWCSPYLFVLISNFPRSIFFTKVRLYFNYWPSNFLDTKMIFGRKKCVNNFQHIEVQMKITSTHLGHYTVKLNKKLLDWNHLKLQFYHSNDIFYIEHTYSNYMAIRSTSTTISRDAFISGHVKSNVILPLQKLRWKASLIW